MEALIVAMLLIGAAYAVLGLRDAAPQTDRTRSELDRLVQDAVTVLGGMRDDRGARVLDADLLETMHCQADAAPSDGACLGSVGINLSLKMSTYLPAGTAWALVLDNGLGARTIYRVADPSGEAVAASVAYAPDWNFTFVVPELSCYDPLMSVNATLLPLANGGVASASYGGVRMDNGLDANATNSTTLTGAWNVTLPAGARPASGNATANLTSKRGTLAGFAHYGSCAIDAATGNATLVGLRNVTVTPSVANVSVGSSVQFSVDLGALAAVGGVTIGESRLSIYEPMPGRWDAPDAWIPTANLTLPAGTTSSVTWTAPASATFGVHPVVLRTNLTIGGTTVEARLLTTIAVALQSGIVPIEPPYRVSLQAWFRDWH